MYGVQILRLSSQPCVLESYFHWTSWVVHIHRRTAERVVHAAGWWNGDQKVILILTDVKITWIELCNIRYQ